MFEKIFGKKKSIQRNLIADCIISIVIVIALTIFTFYVLIDNQALEKVMLNYIGNPDELRSIFDNMRKTICILAFNTILISAITMGITTKKIVQPIQKITDATKKVAGGNFNVQLQTKREDEIGDLTHNFNQMVKDLGSIECLQKEFIDNVSHEIKTPITSIQGFAKLLEDNTLTDEERKEYSNIIAEESNRLLNISSNILKLSKLQNQYKITKKEEINVAEQIRKAIAILEPKWREKEIRFNISMKERYFLGDEELIFQIWMNILDNAIKFSHQKGVINVVLKDKEEGKIQIDIKDYGVGMNEEEQENIFKRFYQIDKSHSEEGSGLRSCHSQKNSRVIQRHHSNKKPSRRRHNSHGGIAY